MSLWKETNEVIPEVHEISVPSLGKVPVSKGSFADIPKHAQKFIGHWVEVMQPTSLFICDGSEEEADGMIKQLVELGTLRNLPKYKNNWICRTDPKDVARVESKTFICTQNKREVVPDLPEGVKGVLGQWISPDDLDKALRDRLPGCMKGRTMYVIPFSMGPVGSPLSKVGVEITDSLYVVLCMRIMTRLRSKIWDIIKDEPNFVRCVHSVGLSNNKDYEKMIISYGSGYGGNSLLGKKCFALRIAGKLAHDEGWLAEHMLIMSLTNPQGEEKFVAAAFPSACGKTNMAMLESKLPGWKIQCVGDDIAWMRFDKQGVLRAINPEYGFFGVAPGTNTKTNPNAIATCLSNTIFTNVAETADGHFFWEGLESDFDPETEVTTWLGHKVKISDKSHDPKAHPNSRFCCPASQCPIIHPKWEDPEGVPISAIIFGGRRPEGIPLVLQSFDWKHGVMLGAALKSEATAAAEFTGKVVMHDPMAMRPFVGYNFGKYLEHWLKMEQAGRKMPLIFHVNWFRLDENGKFVWPGFGDNVRVLDWMLRRVNGEDVGEECPIGIIPKEGTLNTSGLDVNWKSLFSLPKDYLLEDVDETMHYLEQQVSGDLPETIRQELVNQRERIQTKL